MLPEGRQKGGSHPNRLLSDDEEYSHQVREYETVSLQQEATITKPRSATCIIKHLLHLWMKKNQTTKHQPENLENFHELL